MNDISTQAFAGMGPLQLLKWYREHKDSLAKLETYYEEWHAISEPADSEVGLQKRVEVSLEFAKTLAEISDNATASQIVDTAGAIIDNPALLGIFAKMISPLIHAKAPVSPTPNAPPPSVVKTLSYDQLAEHRDDIKALGFDFAKIADLAPLIAEILKFVEEVRK